MQNPNLDPVSPPANAPVAPSLPPATVEPAAPVPVEAPTPGTATAAPAPAAPAPSPAERPAAGGTTGEPEEIDYSEFEQEAGFMGDLWRAIRRANPSRRPMSIPIRKPVIKGVKPGVVNPIAKDFIDNMEFILPGERRMKMRMPDFDSENRITNLLNVQAEYYQNLLNDAKRGVITDVQLRQKAHRIISDLSLSKWKLGEIPNAEHQFAAREATAEMALGFIKYKDTMVSKGVWDLPETREQTTKLLGTIFEMMKRAYASSSETGRALRVPQVEIKGFREATKLAGIAQKMNETAALSDGHLTMDQLFDALRAMRSPDDVTNVVGLWANARGLWYEFWLNGLISGPVTLGGNVVGNTLGLGNAVLERYLAGGWGAMLRSTDRVYLKEGNAMIGEIIDSLGDAWRSAAKVYHEEALPSFSKLDTVSRGTWSVEALGDSAAARTMDTLGYWIVRHPSRFLQGTDQFFKFLAFRAGLRAEAERLATQQGLKGAEYSREVNRIMNSPDVFESVHSNAEAFSSYVTYTQDLGQRGMKLLAARDALGPLGHIAFPFVKTPTNVMKQIGERLPFVNIGGEYLYKRLTGDTPALYGDFMAGGARQQMALAKVSSGMTAAALIWYWASHGYITGMGSKDPQQTNALQPTGWKEYSIYIPGYGYLGYNRTDPLGGFIATVASLAQLSQGHHLAANEIDDLAAAALAAYSDTFLTRSFVMGFSRIADAIADIRTGKIERGAERFISQTVGSVVPNFFAQFNRQFLDNRQTEMDGILDRFASRVPFFSKGVRAVRNIWGDEVRYATVPGIVGFVLPFDWSKEVDDPEAKEIYRLGMTVPEIPDHLFGTKPQSIILDIRRKGENVTAPGVNLTPEQQDRFAYLRGHLKIDGVTLRGRVRQIINDPDYKSRERTDGPLGTRASEIGAAFRAYHTEAEQKLLSEFKELRKAQEAGHEKRAKLKLGEEETGDVAEKIIKMFQGGGK